MSRRQLNRAVLARQLLLERSALPIPRALEQLAGIQNQYAPNAYIRLWSCLQGFRRNDLTEAYRAGTVIQATLMRGTIHAVSAEDYRPFAAAIREHRQRWSRALHGSDDSDRGALVGRVRAALEGRSVPRRELEELRGDASMSAWQTIDTDAELVRVPPSGTWERRRADIYALADDRPARSDGVRGGGDPLEHLVRRYLAGFGPAGLADVASFAGVQVTVLKPIVQRMELRTFRDEDGRALLDVREARLPDEEVTAPVRFLPTWDAILLVHARRAGVLPEEYRPLIFHTKMPPSYPTFLVDGRVAGTWRYQPEDRRIELNPFTTLPRAVRRDLDDEAGRLASFHAD